MWFLVDIRQKLGQLGALVVRVEFSRLRAVGCWGVGV